MQGDAHLTMAEARGLLRKIMDGVTLRIVRTGEHTVWDFCTGKCKELPIQIKIDIDD